MKANSVCHHAQTTWAHHGTTLTGLAVTLLALGLRLVRVDAEDFSLDEVYSLWLAQQQPGDIVRGILFEKLDPTPPLYYLLLHAALAFSQTPLVVRLPSVLAGSLMVGVTFRLAMELFDRRVATVSALLLALAPFHIEYSQVARAYMLGALAALLSLYFFARLVLGPEHGSRRRWAWGWLVAATTAALYIHYLTFLLVVLFENALVAFVWLRRALARPTAKRWLLSQVAVGMLVLPLSWSVLGNSGTDSVHGQTWIPRPGLQAIVRTVILFTTGDPSSIGVRVTLGRALSLLAVAAISAVGLGLLVRRESPAARPWPGRPVLFVATALVTSWVAAFSISQIRPIYVDKYFLFWMPLSLMLIAWVLASANKKILSGLMTAAFVCLLGRALFVYYSEIHFEEWRKAIEYLRERQQPGDIVVIDPGFNIRPYFYYYFGTFSPQSEALSRFPAIVGTGTSFEPLDVSDQHNGASSPANAALASARRLWLVSSGASSSVVLTPGRETALGSPLAGDLRPLDGADFAGDVHVRLLSRVDGGSCCVPASRVRPS